GPRKHKSTCAGPNLVRTYVRLRATVDLGPFPRQTAAGPDPCRDESPRPQLALVQDLEPAGPEAIEPEPREALVLVVRETRGVQRVGFAGRVGVELAGGPEQLDPPVRLPPRLGRLVDGDRDAAARADVAGMLRTRVRQPDEFEFGAPGEVGRVDVGAAAGREGRDRAGRRR